MTYLAKVFASLRAPLWITAGFIACGGLAGAQPAEFPEPRRGDLSILADRQEMIGEVRHLRGNVELRVNNLVLTCDELDYNEASGEAEARGNVRYKTLDTPETLHAEKLSYNIKTETGTFYDVHGYVSSASQGAPRMLTTDNPFYIEGKIVYKAKNHYTVHGGFITNCEASRPWWTMRAPRTKIVPGQWASARNAVFRLRGIPLFYFPYFRRSLEETPRQSGLLTPNFGRSSRFGMVLGQSYYWAINRSYDATFAGTWYSDRGVASQIGFRGRPTANSSFDATFHSVKDRGLKLSGGRRLKQGGRQFTMRGSGMMPAGFRGVAQINYLSSIEFRQAFTQSFEEAVFAQVKSIGFVSKNISTFSMNISLLRDENFQSVDRGDTVIVRQLPSMEFNSHDRRILGGPAPLWFDLESSFGLMSRTQPTFQTRRFVQRGDIFPRLTSSLRLKGFQFTPSFGVRQTSYGQRRAEGSLQGVNLFRNSREFSLDIAPPSLARIYEGPKWIADRIKHVIEPRIRYRFTDGIDNFASVIRFDDTDILTNTNEADFSITNRFYTKDLQSGRVREVMTLEIWQRRYFDPDFGGALVPGQRNVFRSTIDVTPFAFLDRARHASPIVTSLRVHPSWRYGLEWRYDYDQLRDKIVNTAVYASARLSDLWTVEVGHHAVRNDPVLSPPGNQISTLVRFGGFNRRGWNLATRTNYDYRQGIFLYNASQVTYNTDCCGFSFEWRRFAIGRTRNDNQFRIALSIANIGSFGTLRPQEQIF